MDLADASLRVKDVCMDLSVDRTESQRRQPLRWRVWLRRVMRLGIFSLAGFGAIHLGSSAFYALRSRPSLDKVAPKAELAPSEQILVSALTRVLLEDSVPSAERWAEAILRASPTNDVAYLAAVTAQIRRESHFLEEDIEWLFDRLVPDLLHEWGIPDPVNTVGPMQVQRWRLRGLFERTLGRPIDRHEVKQLAGSIEFGVAACVAALDPIILEHYPDRSIRGWVDFPAAVAMDVPGSDNLASNRFRTDLEIRCAFVAIQKMLSDLNSAPLALDGIVGSHTLESAQLFAQTLAGAKRSRFTSALQLWHQVEEAQVLRSDVTFQVLQAAWSERFLVEAPNRLLPRISHDPRLAFVFADFNTGRGASRIAALQVLLGHALDTPVATDGRVGPETRQAMKEFFERFVDVGSQREEFLQLLRDGHKPRWVRNQALRLAQEVYGSATGKLPPQALVPDLWHDGVRQRLKGSQRVSIEGYVAGSVAFFEEYYLRLSTYTGRSLPRSANPASGLDH